MNDKNRRAGQGDLMNDKNRSERARMNAGLSVGQAAHLMGIDRDDLIRAERAETIDDDLIEKFVWLYHTRAEWLRGEVPLHDYAAVDDVKGAGSISQNDRDIIAEFAASMPRNNKTAKERLEERMDAAYKKNPYKDKP